MITKHTILDHLKQNEIQNKSVLLHSSLKSFGYLQGGPKALIDAFLERHCTVIVPTFSYSFIIPPPKNVKLPKQNALPIDYYNDIAQQFRNNKKKIYDPSLNVIHESMGAIPKYVLQIEGRARGKHPVDSFTGVGKHAERIISGQTAKKVYDPIKEVMQDNGVLILAGVDLTKATAIHYAEQLAGRNLFIRWAYNQKGDVITTREGGCSDGFNNLDPYVEHLETQLQVGESRWKLYPLNEFVYTLSHVISKHPTITHCPNETCARCDAAVKGGPYYE